MADAQLPSPSQFSLCCGPARLPYPHPNSPPSTSAARRARVEMLPPPPAPMAHQGASPPHTVLLHLGREELNKRNLEERGVLSPASQREKATQDRASRHHGPQGTMPTALILLSAAAIHTNAPSMQGWEPGVCQQGWVLVAQPMVGIWVAGSPGERKGAILYKEGGLLKARSLLSLLFSLLVPPSIPRVQTCPNRDAVVPKHSCMCP
uniref:Uncharacterized protein n=1 Tax=Pipistrellus kuhlii TaxID=59472 RepID=A0A7J7SVB7_PIPKU|nr:hypothetical protein mPipKuh1_009774 [Pipistrellus kuhlii]